jgi:hypothetical protein
MQIAGALLGAEWLPVHTGAVAAVADPIADAADNLRSSEDAAASVSTACFPALNLSFCPAYCTLAFQLLPPDRTSFRLRSRSSEAHVTAKVHIALAAVLHTVEFLRSFQLAAHRRVGVEVLHSSASRGFVGVDRSPTGRG